MRKFFYILIVILVVMSACSPEPQEKPFQSEDSAQVPKLSLLLPNDYYTQLYNTNARIVASFDYDEFSVWFAITPFRNPNNQDEWDFANGTSRGIPLTLAIVKKVGKNFILVEETNAYLDLYPNNWSYAELPSKLPQMQNHHLITAKTYQYTNFLNTGVLKSYNSLNHPAVMVTSDNTLSLLYQTPVDNLPAGGETIGGISFGTYSDTYQLRHIVMGKDGIISDISTFTKAEHSAEFSTLENFDFVPETQTLTLGNITANSAGVLVDSTLAEFEVLTKGKVTLVDNILGLSARTLTQYNFADSSNFSYQYPIIGESIYRFPFRQPLIYSLTQLHYTSFNLQTHTSKNNELLYDFGTETIRDYMKTNDYFVVYTNLAAYFFDEKLELEKRVPWPVNGSNYVFNEDVTLLAYRSDSVEIPGLYLLNLQTDDLPILLMKDSPANFDYEAFYGSTPFPVFFIDNERLFVEIGVWESVFFQILDTSGAVVEEFAFYKSHDGGYSYLSTAMAFFIPNEPKFATYSYDFESKSISGMEWFDTEASNYNDHYIPDTENPYVWYLGRAYFDGTDYADELVKSEILRVDFQNKTVEPILRTYGTKITILSSSTNGEIVFAYASNNDNGFGILTF